MALNKLIPLAAVSTAAYVSSSFGVFSSLGDTMLRRSTSAAETYSANCRKRHISATSTDLAVMKGIQAQNVRSSSSLSELRPSAMVLVDEIKSSVSESALDALLQKELMQSIQPYSLSADDIVMRGLDSSASHMRLSNCHSDYDKFIPDYISGFGKDSVSFMPQKIGLQDTLKSQLSVGILHCADSSESKPSSKEKKGPGLDDLLQVQDYVIDHLPTIFVARQDYRQFHEGVVFENNYWGGAKITKGIKAYVVEMLKVRLLAHVKYSHVKLDLLKITVHEDEAAVKVLWRVSGISTLQSFKVWKFLPGRFKNTVKQEPTCHDGYSIFTVNKEGQIVRHRVDRVMEDRLEDPPRVVTLGTKVAVGLGLLPKQALNQSNAPSDNSSLHVSFD